jgi:predicted metalloprotease with PDZ domain
MATYWQQFGQPLLGTGDDSFVSFIRQQYGYYDIADFISTATTTTEPLPLTELLAQFGISSNHYAGSDDNNFTGKAVASSLPVSLGARYRATAMGLELTHVYEGEAAAQAHLSAGDRIIAIDFLQVSDATVRELFERFKPGQAVTIHAFHRDELREHTLYWQEPAKQSVQLTVVEPDKLAGWLTPS